MNALRQNQRSAFSVIEALIVIALLVILAAILFPGVQRARYEMRRSQSISNLRNIGSALFSFCNDHNGKLPEGAFRPKLRGVQARYWYSALDFYMGGKDYEPTQGRLTQRPAWQNDPLKVYPTPVMDGVYSVNVGYGWNHAHFGYTPDWYPERLGWGSRLSEVEVPSQTIIVGSNTDSVETSIGIANVMIYAASSAAQRYKGGGLYLLMDGHVATYTPEEILANNNYLFKKRKSTTP